MIDKNERRAGRDQQRSSPRTVIRLLLSLTLIASMLVIAPVTAGADTNVVGGEDAEVGAHPSIASIQVAGQHICGGTLIDAEWILTAAHCVENVKENDFPDPASQFTVVLGEHQMNTRDRANEQHMEVSEIHIHAGHFSLWGRRSWPGADIALMRLASPATLNDRVAVVGIAGWDSTETLTMAGWGLTVSGSSGPPEIGASQPADTLQVAELSDGFTCYTANACFRSDETSGCYGDSGGPWYREDGDGTQEVVIVTSGGPHHCSLGHVSFGVIVGEYTDWIHAVMSGQDTAIFSPNSIWGWTAQHDDGTSRIWGRGQTGQVPLAGDVNGDGIDDAVVYTVRTGRWSARDMGTTRYLPVPAGTAGAIPLTGDLNGDGRDELITFSNGTWNARDMYSNVVVDQRRWGTRGDRPVVGDIDGDGQEEMIVWRPSDGKWYAMKTDGTQLPVVHWGTSGDTPLIGDLDGDGDDDYMIWRPSTGTWYGLDNDGSRVMPQFYVHGGRNDVPLLGDMNNDGQADLIYWRPRTGRWYSIDVRNGNRIEWGTQFGSAGDWPLVGNFG